MKARPITNTKKEYFELELDGKIYKLALTLNAIIELQEIYGDLTAVIEKSKDIKNLLTIFKILINEAVDNHNDVNPENQWEYVDERYVGRKLNIVKIKNLKGMLPAIFGASLPEPKNEETDETVVSDEMKELLSEIPDTDDEKNSASWQS